MSIDSVAIDLCRLDADMKRILIVQFKEFLHTIDDYELNEGIRGGDRFNLPIHRSLRVYILHREKRNAA